MRIVLALFILFTVQMPAFAQDAGSSVVDLNQTVEGFAPLLIALVTAVLSAGASILFAILKKKWGIDIDAGNRNSLQIALDNAAKLGVGALIRAADGRLEVDVGNASVARALQYVLNSAPDAVKHFGLTEAAVREKIEAKIIGLAIKDDPKPVVNVAVT